LFYFKKNIKKVQFVIDSRLNQYLFISWKWRLLSPQPKWSRCADGLL